MQKDKTPIIIDRNIKLSKKGIKNMKMLNALHEPAAPTSEMVIMIAKDNSDPEYIKPMSIPITVSNKYYMLFKNSGRILYNVSNNLSRIDFFLFHFICDNYANEEYFDFGSKFLIQIEAEMDILGMTYVLRSLKNSLSKLVNVGLVFKVNKGLYSINKITAFAGPVNNRPRAIQKQIDNDTINDNNNIIE